MTLSAEGLAPPRIESPPRSQPDRPRNSANSLHPAIASHGLRASKHVLANERPSAHAALAERWRQEFPSDTPDQECLLSGRLFDDPHETGSGLLPIPGRAAGPARPNSGSTSSRRTRL